MLRSPKNKRSVYLVTALTDAEVDEKFADLLQQFRRVYTKADAEFVVIDLTNHANDYVAHLKLPEPEDVLPLPKEIPPPLFLVHRDSQQPVDANVSATVASAWGHRPHLCIGVDNLVQEMLWFERVVPLARTRGNLSTLTTEALALALQFSKTRAEGGG